MTGLVEGHDDDGFCRMESVRLGSLWDVILRGCGLVLVL